MMKSKRHYWLAITACLVATVGITPQRLLAQTPSPTPVFVTRPTFVGTAYCVDKDFVDVLEKKILRIGEILRAERDKGKFIGYISIPLSPTGGGSVAVNKQVCAEIKQYLDSEYVSKLWMLAPCMEEATIPDQYGKKARGQEYMYMWTQILGGKDGYGRDFDLFYFAGPSDFWRALHLTKETSVVKLEALADIEGLKDDAKRRFVSYYAFRASATASRGSHDEWNLLDLINKKRRSDPKFEVGNQVASYFDGRAVEIDDVESSVSTGYEGACR